MVQTNIAPKEPIFLGLVSRSCWHMFQYDIDKQCMHTVSYIVTSSPSCHTSVTKQNPVISISEKDRIRTVSRLFKVKLQAVVIQRSALLKRNFSYVLFSRNFQINYSFELLWVASSERLHSKASKVEVPHPVSAGRTTFSRTFWNRQGQQSYPFICYCLGHWNEENERTKTSNWIVN